MASFRQLTSGRWQAIVRREGTRKLYETFQTRAQAVKWARQVETEIDEGRVSPTNRKPFGAFIARYREEVLPNKRAASTEGYVLNRLEAYFGELAADEITEQTIVAYADERRKAVVSDTVRRELTVLSSLWDTATFGWHESLGFNPVPNVRKALRITRKLKAGNERNRRLSMWEERALLRVADLELFRFVIVALETAMRRGELCNMRFDQIRGTSLYIPHTKTGVPRTIPLTNLALATIGEGEGRVFPYHAHTPTHWFMDACAAAGIKDLRIHDLRHEATSRLFDQGLAIQEVASITGHSDWKSLKRYTHPNAERLAAKLRGQ